MRLIFALLAGLSSVGAQATPLPKAPPVFGIQIENVFIDAFVTRRGTPVTGLLAGDFELRDNGVVQSLDLAASDAQPLLAVLTFDVSGSLDGGKIEALRAASKALLDTLGPEDEASLFAFSDQFQWLAPPSTDKAGIRQALESVRPGGGTAILDALYAAVLLPKFRGRTLVVLFTDGDDNLSVLDWNQVKTVAERSNALVHVVSLRRDASEARELGRPMLQGVWGLRQICEATGGEYWEAESLDRLRTAFAAIAEAMGKRYLLRYAPENVKRPGWHKIELRLKGQKGEVRTRNGYWAVDR